MSDNKKKYSVNNMMLAFIAVLVAVGLVALAGFFLLTPPVWWLWRASSC